MKNIEDVIKVEFYDEGEPPVIEIASSVGACGYSEQEIRLIASTLDIHPLFMLIRIAHELSYGNIHTIGKRPYQNIIEAA